MDVEHLDFFKHAHGDALIEMLAQILAASRLAANGSNSAIENKFVNQVNVVISVGAE